uniref:Uncharacterized protein n=1 Tax=Euplotes crassus TaxID=5936 RepID=A0A7S3NYP2_EUPCR
MDVDQWLRIYETVWYLAIATYFKYHLYLPVSAFNFVYEDCKIIEDENDYNQNYYTIHSYERQIDLETPKEKDFEKVFIRLINNFELVCKNVLEFKPQYSQKVLIAMFNMIGTLITNAETCSDKLCSSLDYYIETISQTESLQNENVEKFIQYFGDKVCCNQFRIDFFEIEAPDKNYTLYNDISENANNQFFAILKITPKSASPDEVVEANYREYYCSKASMILSHRTLVHSLRLKIKNCILQINSAKHISRRPLKMNEFVWISMSDHGDTRKIATECYRNADFYPAVEKLYTLKLELFNIFFNHYTIRNSLDTHFIAAKLNFIEDTLGEVRLTLSQKIQEIECPSNESFNPFIEIGADHEEAKFVSAGDKQDQIQEAVSQAAEDLREAYQELDNTMKAWFMTLPEPETLNVGAKQATLKRKLRWEKMMSSKAKIRELQTVFRKVKMSKKKK